jgi:hypothetical protein
LSRLLRTCFSVACPVLLFLSAQNLAATEVEMAEMEVRLQLLSPSAGWETQSSGDTYNLLALRQGATDEAEMHWRQRILQVLRDHHQSEAVDPEFLQEDMAQLAHYFARYSAVRDLFAELGDARWHWRYSAGDAETRVSGTRLRVNSALILIDTRAGAQFRFQRGCQEKVPHCFTAPADVLLHELLHVRTILRNTTAFMEQGGFSPFFYPHAHELHTLTLERQLYAAMTALDSIPRPHRQDHSGRRVPTSCVTCLL